MLVFLKNRGQNIRKRLEVLCQPPSGWPSAWFLFSFEHCLADMRLLLVFRCSAVAYKYVYELLLFVWQVQAVA